MRSSVCIEGVLMAFQRNAVRVGACAAVLMALVSCGGRIEPQYAKRPTVPKISWTIARKAADGSEHIVCRSESRTLCAISPTAAHSKSFVHVRIGGARSHHSLARFSQVPRPNSGARRLVLRTVRELLCPIASPHGAMYRRRHRDSHAEQII